MKITVVVPVGPGHQQYASAAVASVTRAWEKDRGPFKSMIMATMFDSGGKMGRSKARNTGMETWPADWFFLLDADDEMMPDAFGLVDLTQPATFGAIWLNGRVGRENRWPVTRDTLYEHGAVGTLAMGFFLRNIGLRFDESMDTAEDFDLYMRLPSFTKLQVPLVNIGYRRTSATGPRAGEPNGWRKACRAVVDRYQATQGLHARLGQ